jgi:hypothetical protein
MDETCCSILKAMKLVNVPFDASLLLKFVKTKITGEVRSELLAGNLVSAWQEVKQTLKEIYDFKRTVYYYACHTFSSRQGMNETIASWSTSIHTMWSQFREAKYKIRTNKEMI